jgi:hypothetical protein
MDTEQAVARLLALLDAHRGALTAAVVEADTELAEDRAATAAAAHLLATESEVITGEETDARNWFPYSFMMRVEVPDSD